jgi:hypothetical protein
MQWRDGGRPSPDSSSPGCGRLSRQHRRPVSYDACVVVVPKIDRRVHPCSGLFLGRECTRQGFCPPPLFLNDLYSAQFSSRTQTPTSRYHGAPGEALATRYAHVAAGARSYERGRVRFPTATEPAQGTGATKADPGGGDILVPGTGNLRVFGLFAVMNYFCYFHAPVSACGCHSGRGLLNTSR